jgi:hypothetical protein
MASPSVTYTFSNSTTADGTQVNQNFTDLVNGVSDGTKDLSISALTCAGNVNLNGNTTLGNASSDVLTATGFWSSNLTPSAHNTYDFGITTTNGWRAMYFASSSATKTAKVQGPAISSDIILTLPKKTGTIALNTFSVQRLTNGSAATYTTPADCVAIRVRMVGGGGGGAGSGLAAGSAPGAGTTATFKDSSGVTTLGSAGGGAVGVFGSNGGAGGAVTVDASVTKIVAVVGGGGGGAQEQVAAANTAFLAGGIGGSSYFGGAGSSGNGVGPGAGGAGAAETGGGGGGAGTPNAGAEFSGGGGGSGGYVEFFIAGPAATYQYTVSSTAGTAGGAGTGGAAQVGGAGGTGIIIVEEYY